MHRPLPQAYTNPVGMRSKKGLVYDQPSCGASAVTKIGLEKTQKHFKKVLGGGAVNAFSLVPESKKKPQFPLSKMLRTPARRRTCKAEAMMPVLVEITLLPPPELRFLEPRFPGQSCHNSASSEEDQELEIMEKRPRLRSWGPD